MFLCVGCLDTLELPPHPKLAAYERHARYLMYHDFGMEEGVSEQQLAQVGAQTWCKRIIMVGKEARNRKRIS